MLSYVLLLSQETSLNRQKGKCYVTPRIIRKHAVTKQNMNAISVSTLETEFHFLWSEFLNIKTI